MDQKYIVALELSGTQVRGALASVDAAGSAPVIEAIVTENSDDCVQYGRVQNLNIAAKAVTDVLQAIETLPGMDGAKIEHAYVALGGRSFGSELVTTEIALPSESIINNENVKQLFQEASTKGTPNMRVQKVLARKYYVDNQAIATPVGVIGHRLKGDFTLVTSNPSNQRNLDLVMDKDLVNLKVEYVVTPIALANMLLTEEDKQLGSVLVDLGYQTTTISIYKNRALQYLVTLPMGAGHITRDIANGLNVTLEKAESLKCSYGDAIERPTHEVDEITRANSYVAARAYEIVANIVANINYAKYKPADLPQGFVLVGRGSRLHNLDQLLATNSKMRVRHAELPANVRVEDINVNRPDDFMALISVVMDIAKNPKVYNCVHITRPVYTEPVPETVIHEEPETVTETVYTPVQPSRQTSTDHRTDDDDWDKDDDAPGKEKAKDEKPTKKPKPKGPGWLAKLQRRVANVISDSDLDDDIDLDNE